MTAAAAPQARSPGFTASLSAWKPVLIAGLLFGLAALYVTLVGIVGTFEDREIIEGTLTVAHAVLVLTAVLAGYVGFRRAPGGVVNAIIGSAIAGLISGAALSLLIIIGPMIDLRSYLPNASPDLYSLISGADLLGVENASEMWKGEAFPVTFWFPAVVGMSFGALGGLLAMLPRTVRVLTVAGVAAVIAMGLFSSILRSPMLQHESTSGIARQLFAANGLTLVGVALVLGIVFIAYLVHRLVEPVKRYKALPDETKGHPAVVIPAGAILLLVVLLSALGLHRLHPGSHRPDRHLRLDGVGSQHHTGHGGPA